MPTPPSFVGTIRTDDKVLGSGFIVAPDYRLVATAAHVINKPNSNIPIAISNLRFQPLGQTILFKIKSLIGIKPAHQEDIVLLELSEPLPDDIEVPTLLTHIAPTSDVWVIGYAVSKGLHREYKSAQGKLKGITIRDGINLYELDMHGSYHGMSGAPIIFGENNVIGVLTERVKEEGSDEFSTALVTPIEYVITLDNRIDTPRTRYLKNLMTKLLNDQRSIFGFEEYCDLQTKILNSSDAKDNKLSSTNALTLYDKYRKLMLVGESGAGKSTVLRHFAIQAAQKALDDLKAPLPVFINLYSWRGEDFNDFLHNHLTHNLPASVIQGNSVRQQLEKTPFCLFLDGLDEVNSNIRILKEWVERTNVKLVLTCRTSHFFGIRRFNIPAAELKSLDSMEIFTFANTLLRDTMLADKFTNIVLPADRDKFESRISQLATNPFFLTAMITEFQHLQAKNSNDTLLYTRTQWHIVTTIIRNLWETPRILDLLASDHILEQKYAKVDAVIDDLAHIAFSKIGQRLLSRKEAERTLDAKFLKILDESQIISLEENELRFQHQLFADYFAAHRIDLKNIDDYLQKEAYLASLGILSTRSSSDRKQIQQALLKILPQKSQGNLVKLIGEIGDEQAIDILIELQEQYPKNAEILIAMAKIANRLSDTSKQKKQVVHLLKSIMLNPTWAMTSNGDILYELGWAWGDYLTAVEAMSYIHSYEALDAILEILDESAHFFYDKMPNASLLREQWFGQYISNLGGWAVPRLLEAINSDHPDVSSTIARAILQMNRPVGIKDLGKILLNHPNPRVRYDIALTLGKHKHLDAIPYLKTALKDIEIWSRGSAFTGYVHYFVADSAATGLAYINSDECKTILRENLYEENGNWTDDLLVQRLDSVLEDVIKHDPWRSQIAMVLAARSRLDLLLPRLNHGANVAATGFRDIPPVVLALIKRFHRSQSDDILNPRLIDYIDITPQLISYLHAAEDITNITNLAWTLVLLGKVGNEDAYPELIKYLKQREIPELCSAAAYGLGSYLARHTESFPNVEDLCDLILEIIDYVQPTAYGGIGYGLSDIIGAHIDNPIVGKIRASLIPKIYDESINISKTSLDALEIICLNNSRFIDEQVQSIIDISPSYYMKLGNSNYDAERIRELNPALAAYARYDETLENYQKALTLKETNNATFWTSRYNESDWRDLGCSDGILYHWIGRVQGVLKNWSMAAIAFEQSSRSFASQSNIDSFEKPTFLYSMLEGGNVTLKFLNMPEVAMQFYTTSLDFAQILTKNEWRVDGLPRLFIYSMGLFQSILKEHGYHQKAIEIGSTSLALMDWCAMLVREEAADIYVNMCQSALSQGDNETALSYIQHAYDRLHTSPRRKFRASTYLQRADILIKFNPTADIETDVLEALRVFRKVDDSYAISQALFTLAQSSCNKKNYTDALKLYQESLSHSNKLDTPFALDQSIITLHHIALLFQDQGLYSQAKMYYEKILNIIKEENVPTLLTHVILPDYAKTLHLAGEHEKAIDILISVLQERSMMNLDAGYAGDLLTEIDTEPGCKMPATIARKFADETISAMRGTESKREVLTRLEYSIDYLKKEGGNDREIEYIAALHRVLQDKNIQLPEENPYSKYFVSVEQVKRTKKNISLSRLWPKRNAK